MKQFRIISSESKQGIAHCVNSAPVAIAAGIANGHIAAIVVVIDYGFIKVKGVLAECAKAVLALPEG